VEDIRKHIVLFHSMSCFERNILLWFRLMLLFFWQLCQYLVTQIVKCKF